jgi:hypothetical protein
LGGLWEEQGSEWWELEGRTRRLFALGHRIKFFDMEVFSFIKCCNVEQQNVENNQEEKVNKLPILKKSEMFNIFHKVNSIYNYNYFL